MADGIESEKQKAPRWHLAAIAGIPALLTALNPNWLFQNNGHMDPWFYFGDFSTFPRFHNLRPYYPDERMTWIAPGYVLTRIFGHVTGVMVLHWAVLLAALYLLYALLLKLVDVRTAFLSTLLMGVNSLYVGANGWDYPEGLAIALLLGSLLIAVKISEVSTRADRGWYVLAGVVWMALMFTYLNWLMFSPFYLYVLVSLSDTRWKDGKKLLRMVGWLAVGAVIMTGLQAAAYYGLGGRRFFFGENLMTAFRLAQLQNNPWLESQWLKTPSWLVFPILAFCLAIAKLLRGSRDASSEKRTRVMVAFYLLCFLSMAIMTLRQNRLLLFDYRTSILIPIQFVVLALTVFRVPSTISNRAFYTIAVGAAIFCAAPLAKPDLYLKLGGNGKTLLLVSPLLAIGLLRLWRDAGFYGWALATGLFAAAAFGLIPANVSAAWRMDFDGKAVSERTIRAVQLISARIPETKFPIFWINNYDERLTAEFRAVMCAFLSHHESMYRFPQVDKTYSPGDRLVVLSQYPSLVSAAAYQLARAGIPAEFVAQDTVEYAGETYWITHFDVRPNTMTNLRSGFSQVNPPSGIRFPAVITPGEVVSRKVVFPEAGIYQIELHQRLTSGKGQFGIRSGDGTWIEKSVQVAGDSGQQVSWFRYGAVKNQEVELSLATDGGGSLIFGEEPGLVLMREDRGVSVSAFNTILAKPDAKGNLIRNGGFEAGGASWDWRNGELHMSTDCVKDSCVEFRPQGTPNPYVIQSVASPLRVGDQYTFRAWIKAPGGRAQRLQFGIWDPTASRWVASEYITASADWREYTVSFRNDSSNPLMTELLELDPKPGAIRIDETVLEEAKGPAQ